MTIVKVLPSDSGCWIDGHWGQYGVARLVEIAEENGWVDTATTPPFAQPDGIALAHKHLASMGPSLSDEITSDEYEHLVWASDDAEVWMNENVAPEGYSFGWFDGEWFLWSTEQWEEGE